MKKHKTLVLIIIFTFIVFLVSIFLIWYPPPYFCYMNLLRPASYYTNPPKDLEDLKEKIHDWYVKNFCPREKTIFLE